MDNTGIKWGVIGAVSTLVISLVTYLIGPKFYIQGGSWIGLVALIVILVMAGKEERTKLGGFANFQELLRPIFMTYIITAVASTILQVIMYKVVDPGLADLTKQISLESLQKMKGMLGEEGYESALEEMEKQDCGGSVRQYIVGLAMNLLIGFGVSALISAIIKRTRPENLDPYSTVEKP